MPLDGLRAWIGEVERKLGMRTRVFLVLATIAIGGAGAAIYLALDTRDDAVGEADVRALQQDLEAQIATGGGGGTALASLEAKVTALEAEIDQLRGKGGDAGGSANGGASGGTGTGSESGGSGSGSDTGGADEASGGVSGGGESKARLPKLLGQTERDNAEAEK